MPFNYFAMLRTKSGEANALANLTVQAKDRLRPIMHVVENPAAGVAASLISAWSGRSLALDGLYNLNFKGTPNDFSHLFRSIGNGGVRVIPSIQFNAPPRYLAAAQPFTGRYAPGLVVKVALGDLAQAGNWVAAQGWQRADIDLVVDLGHVGAYDPAVLARMVVNECRQNIPQNHGWRSVALSSAAAPKDFGGLPLGRSDIPRLDWRLWNATNGQLTFELHYGDYGIGHPDLDEPPGAAMARATVSVRYTTADNWIALKGTPQGGRSGRPMAVQYSGHARTLARDPLFGGLTPCWGDDRIRSIAAGTITSGNRAKWVEYGANRHLCLVARDLP